MLRIECDSLIDEFDDPVTRAIRKYDAHPSILKIKENIIEVGSFSFHSIDLESVVNEIASLCTSKATPKDSIPVQVIKDNYDIFAYKIFTDFNTSINDSSFPSNQKYADVSPVYKKGDKLDKSNYRTLAYYQHYLKSLKDCYFTKSIDLWILNWLFISVDFVRIWEHKTA